MSAHIAPEGIVHLFNQLSTVISMLQPDNGQPDPQASLALRKIVYFTFTCFILMLERRGINYDYYRSHLYRQLQFLQWSIHSLYGTQARQSFLESPTE